MHLLKRFSNGTTTFDAPTRTGQREIQALSGRQFTLDAAANDSGDNALCTEFHSPSNSFLSKTHDSGHMWINAPFMKLLDFLKPYNACKALAGDDLSACILVPGYLLLVLKPHLLNMHLLKRFSKGTTMFDAPTRTGQRRPMPGVHWPIYIYTDCLQHQLPQPDIGCMLYEYPFKR